MESATEVVVESTGPTASVGIGAATPIGRAFVANSDPGPALSLAGGVRFATHWFVLGKLEGAILTHNPSRTGFVGVHAGYASAPGRVSLLASVGGGWRFYSYDLDIVEPNPSISFFRTGPEAQGSLGIAVPITRTLSLTSMAQMGAGAFVTTSGCCETQGPIGPISPFGSAYPRTTDPFAFLQLTVGMAFDGGISEREAAER